MSDKSRYKKLGAALISFAILASAYAWLYMPPTKSHGILFSPVSAEGEAVIMTSTLIAALGLLCLIANPKKNNR